MVPKKKRSYNMYSAAIEQNGYMLYAIPTSAIDEELCLKAVRQNGAALKFVPEIYRTAAVKEAAIGNSPLAAVEALRHHHRNAEIDRSRSSL